MRKISIIALTLGLLVAFGVNTKIVNAQKPSKAVVVFELMNEKGRLMTTAKARMDLWVRSNGANMQTKQFVRGIATFVVDQNVEYMGFLGIAPWPEPGQPQFKVTGLEYKNHITPSNSEVGPYATFTMSKYAGQIRYTLSPIN